MTRPAATAPALGLRAGAVAFSLYPQTSSQKEKYHECR